MLNKVQLFFFGISIFISSALIAQTAEYEIFQLRFLYNEIKFEEVISKGNELLKDTEILNKFNLTEIHTYLALSFYNIGKQDSSRSHFYTLLSLDADFEPDAVNTSPKILSFFQEIKNSFRLDYNNKVALPFKSYIFVEDIRPMAALRSLVFPGWGQYYKEQKSKAYIFGITFLTTSVITIATYSVERNYREEYLNESNPSKIEARYNDYNGMSKTRRVFQYTAIAIWAAGIGDALFSEYEPMPQISEDYAGIAVYISF